MQRVSTRLRTAFLLSVADVFFGAVGVLVIVIVLAANRTELRIVERFDFRATCSGGNAASLRLRPDGGGESVTIDDWLAAVPSDRFMMRLGLRSESDDITCYHLIRQAALDHNSKLERRGSTRAVLSIEYWRRGDNER